VSLIFGYMALIQLVLPALLWFLQRNQQGAGGELTVVAGANDALAIALYIAALALAVAAFQIPPRIARTPACAAGAPLAAPRPIGKALNAYVVRLGLLEAIGVCGFALGMVRGAYGLALPFAAVGLALTLASPPRRTVAALLGASAS
jgi:hypothetical protein